jgi:hypothetical protein
MNKLSIGKKRNFRAVLLVINGKIFIFLGLKEGVI